jgi:hypothetical protein
MHPGIDEPVTVQLVQNQEQIEIVQRQGGKVLFKDVLKQQNGDYSCTRDGIKIEIGTVAGLRPDVGFFSGSGIGVFNRAEDGSLTMMRVNRGAGVVFAKPISDRSTRWYRWIQPATEKLYPGQVKPDTEVATVAQVSVQEGVKSDPLASHPDYFYFYLRGVDGVELSSSGSSGVSLLPGKHRLVYEIRLVGRKDGRLGTWANVRKYELTVSLGEGQKATVAFSRPEGSNALCIVYTNLERPFRVLQAGQYPLIKAGYFPLQNHYERICTNAGVDLSESAWMEIDKPGSNHTTR